MKKFLLLLTISFNTYASDTSSLAGIWDFSYDGYSSRVELFIDPDGENKIIAGVFFFEEIEEPEAIVCVTRERVSLV